MNQDQLISDLYDDYARWCRSEGRHCCRYEQFHNLIIRYGTESYTEWKEYVLDHYATQLLGMMQHIRDHRPLQPDDKANAVAEVERMRGGEG